MTEEKKKENPVIAALQLNLDTLTTAMCQQPAMFVRVAIKAAQAKAKLKRAELEWKTAEADASLEIRDRYADGKKPTEGQIDAEVKTSPVVRACVEKYLETYEESLTQDAVVEAYRQRADMLVSAGADVREERKRTT